MFLPHPLPRMDWCGPLIATAPISALIPSRLAVSPIESDSRTSFAWTLHQKEEHEKRSNAEQFG